MKKVIVLSRVSTSHQDLTQQTEEILREVHKDGYTDPNIIIIEDVESAIKLSEEERLTIKERMASGRKQYIDRCRREGVKMGRPDTYRKNIEEYKKQYQREFSLIRKGLSLANISAITGTSINTIRKLRILVREGRM